MAPSRARCSVVDVVVSGVLVSDGIDDAILRRYTPSILFALVYRCRAADTGSLSIFVGWLYPIPVPLPLVSPYRKPSSIVRMTQSTHFVGRTGFQISTTAAAGGRCIATPTVLAFLSTTQKPTQSSGLFNSAGGVYHGANCARDFFDERISTHPRAP